jgi:hypothetical protein
MADERRRQKKLQKHREKREAKRRALAAEDTLVLTDFAALGIPKMSDTLVAFARPVLDEIPDKDDVEQFEKALIYAAMVWNAVTAGPENELQGHLDAIAGKIASSAGVPLEGVRLWVERLAQRKLQQFAEDPRMVLDVSAYDNGDEFRILAASALPGSSPDLHP